MRDTSKTNKVQTEIVKEVIRLMDGEFATRNYGPFVVMFNRDYQPLLDKLYLVGIPEGKTLRERLLMIESVGEVKVDDQQTEEITLRLATEKQQ